jgi:anti-sigma factor RsiW
MTNTNPINESDIHAYVDGELPPERLSEVEPYILSHPEDAQKAKEYHDINQALKQLYDPVLEEPVPDELLPRAPRQRLWAIAAAVTWLGIGGFLGWGLHPQLQVEVAQAPQQWDLLQPNLVKPATFAHVVYSPEVRHPVEVSADQEQHLVTWLSKRMGTDIHAPDLVPQGYHLIGGRLLPSTNRMAAQFMYERKDGQRATLYVRRGAWENEATAFHFERDGSLGVFYWIDGPMGYALIGDVDRGELHKLSEAVYEQL